VERRVSAGREPALAGDRPAGRRRGHRRPRSPARTAHDVRVAPRPGAPRRRAHTPVAGTPDPAEPRRGAFRRPASQRQRRPASSRLQGADRTSGVMQCCGRASTAPARRRADGRRGCERCGWNARAATSSSASSSGGSRSRAARARSRARCTARRGAFGCEVRQNMCSYGAGATGWKAPGIDARPVIVDIKGSIEPRRRSAAATRIAEHLFGPERARRRGGPRPGCRPASV